MGFYNGFMNLFIYCPCVVISELHVDLSFPTSDYENNFINLRDNLRCSEKSKDTASPSSHHVMASSNRFSFTRAAAPKRRRLCDF